MEKEKAIAIKNEELANEFIAFIQKKYLTGVNAEPINWEEYNQLNECHKYILVEVFSVLINY